MGERTRGGPSTQDKRPNRRPDQGGEDRVEETKASNQGSSPWPEREWQIYNG